MRKILENRSSEMIAARPKDAQSHWIPRVCQPVALRMPGYVGSGVRGGDLIDGVTALDMRLSTVSVMGSPHASRKWCPPIKARPCGMTYNLDAGAFITTPADVATIEAETDASNGPGKVIHRMPRHPIPRIPY